MLSAYLAAQAVHEPYEQVSKAQKRGVAMLEWIKLLSSVVYDRRMRQRLIGYRPVVVMLLQSTDGEKFLFIRPAAKSHAWMVPQEGIKPSESIEDAAIRGLGAELGITENQVHFQRSKWLGRKRIPEQQGARDIEYSLVAMQGKAYYAALIKLPESTRVESNPAEIAGHEWLTLDEVRDRLKTNSDRKQELIRSMFQKILHVDL